jgi:hypothetical protein
MFSRNARALASALLVPALLGLAACGTRQAPGVALPAKASAPLTVPAAPSVGPLTPRQAVKAAYLGYWQAYAQAMDAGSPAGARSALAPYTAPATLARLVTALGTVWAAHEAADGAAVPHVLGVQVTGATALLHDCLDLSHFGVVSTTTGLVVSDSFGLPNRNFYITLVLSRGRWLVSNMEPVEVPCQP